MSTRVDGVLADLDFVDLQHRRPVETSLGQQQRLAVARALVASPVLLLADEPTSHQDADHVALVLSMIATRAGAALIAGHDPALPAIADRTVRRD